MHSSSLVKIFSSLSKTDLRGLRKAVRSPYFNQRDDVVRLFDFLHENISKGAAALRRERAFKAVFPQATAFEMAELRHAMSFLLAVVREFLAIEEMKIDGAKPDFYVSQAYKRRGAEEIRERELPDALRNHESRAQRDAKFHHHRFQLLLEDYDLRVRHDRLTEVDALIESMTAYHASTLLRVGCIALSSQNFRGKALSVPLLSEALELAERGFFNSLPAVMTYFLTYRCLESHKNVSHFQRLKALLPELGRHFSPSETGDVFLAAINFCIRHVNENRSEYARQALDIYKLGFETKALLPGGRLTKYTYKNAVAIALHVDEHDWVERFLEENRAFLPERDRENSYRINLAKLHFQKKEYDRALVELQSVNWSEEPLYNLDARRMLVRIFYEQKAFTALSAQLESYRAFIRRHKGELGYHRESHSHFISFVQKMMSPKFMENKQKAALREQISAEKSVVEKTWLLEKCA